MARTVKVERSAYRSHLQKAEECAGMMEVALGQERYNAAVILAVHCGISAADALTLFSFGLRHSGESHREVLDVLRRVEHPDIRRRMEQLGALLSLKSDAEYREVLMSASSAATAVKQAGRFLEWVRSVVAA